MAADWGSKDEALLKQAAERVETPHEGELITITFDSWLTLLGAEARLTEDNNALRARLAASEAHERRIREELRQVEARGRRSMRRLALFAWTVALVVALAAGVEWIRATSTHTDELPTMQEIARWGR